MLIKSTKVHNDVKRSVMDMFLKLVPKEDGFEEDDDEILPGLVQESADIPIGSSFNFPGESEMI